MFKEKKRILILFEFGFIAYSPTTLQIYDALIQKGHHVDILTPIPAAPYDTVISNRNIFYTINTNNKLVRWIGKIIYYILTKIKFLKFFKILKIIDVYSFIRCFFILSKFSKIKGNYDRFIVSDLSLLFFLQYFYKVKADFLSLEIVEFYPKLMTYIDKNLIHSVIIQSEARYTHLFGNILKPKYFIQNAPTFDERLLSKVKYKDHLIFAGTALKGLCIFECLDFLMKFPEFKMTIKGKVPEDVNIVIKKDYHSLTHSGQLIVNSEFMENDEFITYISDYSIGLCFYDLKDVFFGNFNYRTAPSGKLYKYLAAGVPVIAIDIPGFDDVREYNAGILIDKLDPQSLKNAVDTIVLNYDVYRNNAIKLAIKNSFENTSKGFLETFQNEDK